MQSGDRRLIGALFAVIVLLGAAIVLALRAGDRLEGHLVGLRASSELARSTDALLGLLRDAESGQRGFMLTGDAVYLEPYENARAGLPRVFAAFERALPDNPELLGRVRTLADAKLAELTRTIEVARGGDDAAARALVLSGAGRRTMEALRVELDALAEVAQRRLSETRAAAERQGTRLRLAAGAAAALALALGGMVIALLWRSVRRLQHEAALREHLVEDLREAQERNRAVFEQSGDYLFLIDCHDPDDCVYAEVNAETARLLGRPAEEIRGKRPREVAGEQRGARAQRQFRRCVDLGAPLRYENEFRTGDERRVLDVLLMPLRDRDGRVTRLLGSARDITEQRRAEEALRQSQKLEAIGQLTGGVAHDFNNLLQVVIGNLELVAGEVDDPDQRRRLETARAAARRGQALTRQLLAFARRETIEPRAVAVPRTLRRLAPVLRASSGETIAIGFELPDALWPVKVDPAQLENAILNLAVNARDAMPGGGRIVIAARNVPAGSPGLPAELAAGDYVAIAVRDDGSGIPPELLDKVFQPFFTTKPAGKGTGLGLSSVYGMARQAGGTASLESTVGIGTTVTLHLPRAADAPSEPASDAPVIGGREEILLVEDDRDVRAATADLLRGLGYAVTVRADGPSALAALESDLPTDLLLTDVVMPGGLDGIELAKRARRLRPGIAVLIASGHGGDQPGADEFVRIDKPFERSTLARMVRSAIDATRPADAAKPGPETDQTAPVLIVEDEVLVRMIAVETLRGDGYRCVEAGTAAEALAAVDAGPVLAMVADLGLPDLPGPELLRRTRERQVKLPIVISSGNSHRLPAELNLPGPVPVVLDKPYAPAALLRALRDAIGK